MSKLSDETRAARAARSWSPWGEINRILRRHGVRPTRTAKECEDLHDRRLARRVRSATTEGRETLMQVLERRYRARIKVMGHKTVIEKYVDGHTHRSPLRVVDRDVARNLTLLRATEHMHMGTPSWCIAYLCGRDAGGWWCKRVAGTCETVQAAWEWMVPTDVRRAMAAGVEVLRQGDLWAVRAARDGAFPDYRVKVRAYDPDGEPVTKLVRAWNVDRHEWDPETRVVRFVPWIDRDNHRLPVLHVPWPCKWYRSRKVEG